MNKEKIIIATLELACEKGLGSLSMSQIANKVGLKKSSLYSHFSSKDEIIEAMYMYLRKQANHNMEIGSVDYGSYVEGRELKEILLSVSLSYEEMIHNPMMSMFFKVLISEKSINPKAAEIIISETNTMLRATKQLFYAIMAKKIANFENIDAAAITFAMGIHAILDFRCDDNMAGSSASDGILEQFVEEFCRVYTACR